MTPGLCDDFLVSHHDYDDYYYDYNYDYDYYYYYYYYCSVTCTINTDFTHRCTAINLSIHNNVITESVCP